MDVIIRHSEKEDSAAIKAIYAQPSCYEGTLQLPYPSEALWQKRLGDMAPNSYSLVAVVENKVVGQAGLWVNASPRRKHAANIGMAVCEKYQGKGVGSRLLTAVCELANNWLAIRRIELEVYTDNVTAVALYKKHDFAVEGTAKSYAFRNGKYVDVYHMAKVYHQPEC